MDILRHWDLAQRGTGLEAFSDYYSDNLTKLRFYEALGVVNEGAGQRFSSLGSFGSECKRGEVQVFAWIGWMLRGRRTSSITCMNIKCINKFWSNNI